MTDPPRRDPLTWLTAIGRAAERLTPLTGDVSRRSYLRAHHCDGGTSIVATYPPEMTDVCRRFDRTTALLEKAGVRVPSVEVGDCAHGFMLLEDAGDETLYDWRRQGWDRLAVWIETAARAITAIRRVPAAAAAELNPPLDEKLLRRELEQTWDLLLVPRRLAGDDAGRPRLRAALDEICARLGDETPVVCHRDYMARNLVPSPDGELVILDHQDLRLGPPAYDLASLLNDSLFAPAELEGHLIARHATRVPLDSYRRCVVQRALKACGTFAHFARRGSSRHLKLVPPTLRRAAENLTRLPEGDGLDAVIAAWRAADLDATE